MSVNRYDLVGDMDGNCNLNEARMEHSDDGSYVYYEDYAALEARCLELAAENAEMKEEISNITFMRDDDFFGSTQRAQEVMGRLVNVKTPATDSFLAEVRASGVDYAIGVIKDCANNLCPGGTGEAVQYAQEMVTPYLDSIHDKLADKSAQLRKGVQP